MSDIERRGLPASLGGIGLVAGLMASQFAINPVAPAADKRDRSAPFVDYSQSPSTHGGHASIVAATQLVSVPSAGSEIEAFYENLRAKQERLGREFERVLFGNLWKLYAR